MLEPGFFFSPKPPYYQNQHDQAQSTKRTILLQQQFPVYPYRRSLIFGRIFSQSRTHVSHPVQTVSAIQQIFNVLGHDLRDIFQLVVQPTEVVRRPRVLICLLRPLDEAVELRVGVRSHLWVEIVFAFVRGLEFGADVFEIGQGEFLRIRPFGDGEVGDIIVENVAGKFTRRRVSERVF